MSETTFFSYVFFFYGLAFFSMGFAVLIEGDRSMDERLRLSLRPLAAFGILHGLHEWMDMFEVVGMAGDSEFQSVLWYAVKLGILSFSFISLAGFGFSQLSPSLRYRRLTLLGPLALAAIWMFGLFILNNRYGVYSNICTIPCVWTRYALGIPSALAASFGLIAQQRSFRRSGLYRFGRDSLVAAIAFFWYGAVGQLFVPPSKLPPSTFINQELFYSWTGVPIQVIRAILAVIIAIFVIRFMRAFDLETKNQIAELQAMRLDEARRREALRGGLIKRIVGAQEAERQRIARELHDDTGQALTAIGLGLRGVRSMVKIDPEKAEHNLGMLEKLSSASLNELQRIISNLRPAHLDDLGLAAAVRWYLSDVKNLTEMDIAFNLEGTEIDVEDEIKVALYRVIQEATTNAIKHSGGTFIFIILCYTEHSVDLWVEDDGVGIPENMHPQNGIKHWGLVGMQERATLLSGEFTVESIGGEGLKLRISIPYQQTRDTIEAIED